MNTATHLTLKDFSAFIFENHLHQFSELVKDLARKNSVDMTGGITGGNEDEQDMVLHLSISYLRHLSTKTPEEIIREAFAVNNCLPLSQRVRFSSIVSRLSIRKEALISLIPLYTRDVEECIFIVKELESFHRRLIEETGQYFKEIPKPGETLTVKTTEAVSPGTFEVEQTAHRGLSETEGLLKLHNGIVESMTEGVVVTDEKGNILYANNGMERMFQYSSGELTGMNYSDLNSYSREQNETIIGKIVEKLKAKGVWTGEFSSIRKDGTPFITFARITSININGTNHLVWVQEDLSESKKEMENQKLLDKISTVLSSSLDYKLTLKRAVNLIVPALAEWCLLDLVSAKGKLKRVELAYHDPSLKALASKVKKIPLDPKAIYYPPARAITTGEPVYLPDLDEKAMEDIFSSSKHASLVRAIGLKSLITIPLKSRKRIFGAISFARTEQRPYSPRDLAFAEELGRRISYAIDNSKLFKEAADALKNNRITLSNLASAKEQLSAINVELSRKNKELVKINNDLDNFIYTASHDLKTPIANLEGLFSMLSNEYASEEGKVLFPMVATSIARLNKVIKELTEISRIQKDVEDDQESISLEEIAREVLLSLEDDIQRQQATIKTNFSAAPAIYGSKKNLKSIIYNLVSNGLKYRAPDRPCIIQIRTFAEPAHWDLEVEDNGLGISDNHKDKIFNMFRRFHDHVEGTGIGLYIVKRIVENQGGSIGFESEEGKGTVFQVRLRNEGKILSPSFKMSSPKGQK